MDSTNNTSQNSNNNSTNGQNFNNFNQQNNMTNLNTNQQNNIQNIPYQNNNQNFNPNNNQGFNPQPQNPIPKDNSKIVKLLLLLGVLLVIGLLVFLGIKMFSSDKDNSNNLDDYSSNFGNDFENDFKDETVNLNPKFEIVKFVLASNLDEDFNYEEKVSGEFANGENMFIYAEVAGFTEKAENDGFSHSLLESVYVYDSLGNVIENMSAKNLENETNIYDVEGLTIRFSIKNPILDDLEPGVYDIELVYVDLISKESVSEKKEFTVKNLDD